MLAASNQGGAGAYATQTPQGTFQPVYFFGSQTNQQVQAQQQNSQVFTNTMADPYGFLAKQPQRNESTLGTLGSTAGA